MGTISGVVTLGFLGGPLVTLGFGSSNAPSELYFSAAAYYAPGAVAADSFAPGFTKVTEYAPGFAAGQGEELQ